jgi:universal stress protein E
MVKKSYQSILIANEKLEGLNSALAKSAMLEHYSGAKLTLLEVIYDALEKEADDVLPRFEKDRLINAYMAAERHALAEMAKCYESKVASLDTAIAWSESRELGICRFAIQHQVDLIIRPQDPDHSPLETFRDSSIHRLLAHAACPVLVSKVNKWDNSNAILACVDVSDHDHQALNESIVNNGVLMAELLGVPLHILNVAPLPPLSLGRFSSTFDVSAMQERLLETRKIELQRLQASVTGSSSEVIYHLKAGHLIGEIKTLAESIGADIVVMGTACREGMRRFLIGNSAEAVLHRIDADLLCVKENPLQHTEYAD